MSEPSRWRPLARLDRRITTLEHELAQLEARRAELGREIVAARAKGPEAPSLRRSGLRWWREAFTCGRPWSDDPVFLFENKLEGYRWARSHGVDHPPLHGVWATVDDIPWDDLPDEVVVKGAFGHSSRAVLPLRRRSGGWVTITEDVVQTSADLAARLHANEQAEPRFHGPYFAEELMTHPDDPAAKAFEIKAWTHDGEIAFALSRVSVDHHDIANVRFRYWDDEARTIDQIYRVGRTDPDVPFPPDPAAAIEVFRRLSRAVHRPISRVDLFVHQGRFVFGEMTILPNVQPILLPAMDERMGRLWEQAEARLSTDGRGVHPEWGGGPTTLLRADPWLGGLPGAE